jgi:hypothetical protein
LIKTGDLVNFICTWSKHTQKAYANPGIVLEKYMENNGKGHFHVMWADKKITSEHQSYLEPVKNK